METVYAELAGRIIALANSKHPDRVLIGVAGPPGSGKSTVVDKVVAIINGITLNGQRLTAAGVSLDGFHYSRAQLDGFSDPVEAHKRRGAPCTFDIGAIMEFIEILEASKVPRDERREIFAPSFDHAIKDPVEHDTMIPANADIVILDGNYLLLDEDGWKESNKALDFRVFINIHPSSARARIAKRHVLAGIEPTLEMGEKRFDSNDGPNGELIRSKQLECDFVVESK